MSDNSKELTAQLIKSFHEELHVEESHGLPYRPQTQGAVERSHATIKAKWWAILREWGFDVKNITLDVARQILQLAINCYNHEIHSTTGCIPFELFHKRTDRNFNLPLSVAPITETIYSDAQYASLVEKARNGMIKKAAKSVAQ